MVATGSFGVGADLFVSFVDLLAKLEVVLQAFFEVVGVHEVFAGVVWRVDVDHLDAVVVLLLQHLEHFEVVALDEDIFGGVPVFAEVFGRF